MKRDRKKNRIGRNAIRIFNAPLLCLALIACNIAVPCLAGNFPLPDSFYSTDVSPEGPVDALYALNEGDGGVLSGDKGEDLEYYDEETVPDRIADPLEPVNRVFFQFNDKLYFWLMKPVAKGYSAVVPEGARISVRNFFSNISTPVRLVNNLLQLKIRSAGTELLRFGVNSTFGILGLFDYARTEMDISMQDEDFGQTLGKWGIGPVIYLNWPVLGPSSVRDTVGFAGDYFLEPVNYITPVIDRVTVKAAGGINSASLSIGEYERIKKDALDPYTAVKDIYYQYRKSRINR